MASSPGGVAPLLSAISGPTGGPAAQPSYLEGWSATWASGTPPTFTPDSSPQTVSVTRQGFDGTASAVNYTESLIYTQRVRQAYPSQASLTTNVVALSDYVYSTDTIVGVTNSSTLTSPTPVANWLLVDRRVVGNTLSARLTAFHRNARNGKQVAAVKFIVSDGINPPLTQVVSTPTVLSDGYDQQAVVGYAFDFDITSLTDNHAITLDAEVYPWIGDSNAVFKSANGTANSREFCTQNYWKWTARFNSPPYAYVNGSTGVDATVDVNGVSGGLTKVSTTAATAAANPFLTLNSALNALKAATNVTGASGFNDGCIIRISNSTVTYTANTLAGTYQNAACVYIENDPGFAVSACVFTPTNAFALRQSYIWCRNLTITRSTSTNQIPVNAGGKVVVENVVWNNASITSQPHTAGGFYALGTTFNSGAPLGAGANEVRLVRGCTASLNVTGLGNIEGFLVVGNNITAGLSSSGVLAWGARAQTNCSVAFNKFMAIGGTALQLNPGAAANVSGMAICQNVFEYTSATTDPTLGPSCDGNTGNVTHLLVFNNTLAGQGANGRSNTLYDEKVSTYRLHKLCAFKGNIQVQIFHKGDVFVGTDNGGTPNPTDAPNHVGNWSYLYGVGCKAEFSQQHTLNVNGLGDVAGQAYGGLGSSIGGTSLNDPLFTLNKAYNGSAGAGGGTYTLQGGSPVRSMLADNILAYDLAGSARSTSADIPGAYV